MAQLSSHIPQAPFQLPIAQLTPELFVCPCSKQYKSYAAIYTHVKNKHSSQPAYRDNIKRPSWVKTQKGRPKKFEQTEMQSQEKIMQICEMGLLQIVQKLKGKTDIKPYLIGDSEHSQKQISLKFAKINESSGFPLQNSIASASTPHNFYQFYNQFNKHMSEEMASRLLWTLNYLELQNNYIEQSKPTMALTKIWFGCEDVVEEITRTYDKWKKVVEQSHPQSLQAV